MKLTQKHKWMRKFEEAVHMRPEYKNERIDWKQAETLYQRTLAPEVAALRYRVFSKNFHNLLLTVGAVV